MARAFTGDDRSGAFLLQVHAGVVERRSDDQVKELAGNHCPRSSVRASLPGKSMDEWGSKPLFHSLPDLERLVSAVTAWAGTSPTPPRADGRDSVRARSGFGASLLTSLQVG